MSGLTELVAKWRGRAKNDGRFLHDRAYVTLNRCADELESALAADRAGVGQEVEQRDMAIAMLASWVACVQRNGTGWDDWDEAYKDAAYRPTPLRELLDAAIAKELKSWESPTPEASRAK